jgi:branched-chain amino acid transport system substrate-binding protein
MPFMLKRVLVVLLLAASILLWTRPCESAVKEKQEILIGTHLPLSGLLASIGEEQRWAYETAVRDINAKGGIYVREYAQTLPVRLMVIDDGTDPARAALAVKHLIEVDKVDLLLGGHATSSGVIPGCITAEKYGKYYHATGAFPPPWLEHDFQWATLLFFDVTQAATVPFQIWNSLPLAQRPRRAALFVEATFAGKAFMEAFVEQARAYGYKFALIATMAPSSNDYAALVARASALDVDAILVHAAAEDCISLIRSMKSANFSVKYLHGWKGTWSNTFWQSLGADAQYILSDGHWSKEYPYAGAQALARRYTESFQRDSISVGAFYATASILWSAIAEAGSLHSAKVRRAVLKGSFQTVLGPIKYGRNGVGVYPSPAFQWWDGKLIPVYQLGEVVSPLKSAPHWRDRR